MDTNSNQSTDKNRSGAVCRIMGMLFGLFAFIWLPTPEVDAALLLNSPPNCERTIPYTCEPTDKVTVFRWTPSENPENRPNHSYRVIFSRDPDFPEGENILVLPTGDEKIIVPQVALDLEGGPTKLPTGNNLYWRVDELDESGDVYEKGQETFAFFYELNQDGYTVITGLVNSDRIQAALVGAQVAVTSDRHKETSNNIAATVFNGEYIVIAFTTDNQVPIDFPIEITSTKPGFQPTTVILQESERQNGVITRDVVMSDVIPPSDSIELISPPDCPPDPETCDPIDGVIVFRWTDDPDVISYRLEIDTDKNFSSEVPKLSLPQPGDKRITAPQVAVRLEDFLDIDTQYFWRVIGLNQAGEAVQRTPKVFSFFLFDDPGGFTIIQGLIQSDRNQAALVGATVAVSSVAHADTLDDSGISVEEGQYDITALTTDREFGETIEDPLQITATKEGYLPLVEDDLQDDDGDGTITLNLTMIADSDGDGIRDAVEIPSCLNENDADTDDDGIGDGDEDTNKDGVKDPGETNPCSLDTDNDGIQDGTELGLTENDIGSDTGANFKPDLDPTTTTNPLDADTDNDGIEDGEEDANHNGRVDAGETDPRRLRAGALPAILQLLIGN